ncbi:MAG: helix-turn-helix domain-containing protein [bacterium]
MAHKPMHAKLTQPKHIAAAVLTALLVGGVGTVIAAAPHPGESSAPPAPFTLAWPNVGDRGQYRFEGNGTYRFPLSEGVDFETLGDVIDYQGTSPVLANRFSWRRMLLGDDPGGTTVVSAAGFGYSGATHFAAGTVDGTAWNLRTAGGYSYNETPLPGLPHSTTGDWDQTVFADVQAPCGGRSALQGRTWDLQKPLPELGGCDLATINTTRTAFLIPRGEVPNAPHRTIVVDWFSSRFNGTDLRLWFQEDIPYPVRMKFVVDPWNPERGGYSYRLVSFERGRVPIADKSGVALPSMPPVKMAPRTETIVEDSGVVHPFPLSEAWAEAKSDVIYSDVRTFLAAHPTAYLGAARLSQSTNAFGEVSYTWRMIAADPRARLAFDAIRTVPALGGLGPVRQAGHDEFQGDAEFGQFFDGMRFLPRDNLPAMTPTVASMFAQYQAFRPGEVRPAPNAWDFWLGCYDDQVTKASCTQAQPYYQAGHREAHYNLTGLGSFNPLQTTESSGQYLEWTVPEDGPHAFMTVSSGEKTDVAPAAAQLPASKQPFTPLDAGAAGFWKWPSVPAVEAVGGLAIIAGLLWWVWPAAKGGAVGLFSRVQAEDVLANPTRARIAQLVQREPGIHLQELVRRVGIGNGAVEHHLRTLAEAGAVVASRRHGYTCYFPRGTGRLAMEAAPLVKSPVAKAILAAARGQPGVTSAEVARRLGVSPPTVHYHVDRLRKAGILRADLAGLMLVGGPSAVAA